MEVILSFISAVFSAFISSGVLANTFIESAVVSTRAVMISTNILKQESMPLFISINLQNSVKIYISGVKIPKNTTYSIIIHFFSLIVKI